MAHFEPESLAHFHPEQVAHFEPEYLMKEYRTLNDLTLHLNHFYHIYNNVRLHGSLKHLNPSAFIRLWKQNYINVEPHKKLKHKYEVRLLVPHYKLKPNGEIRKLSEETKLRIKGKSELKRP